MEIYCALLLELYRKLKSERNLHVEKNYIVYMYSHPQNRSKLLKKLCFKLCVLIFQLINIQILVRNLNPASQTDNVLQVHSSILFPLPFCCCRMLWPFYYFAVLPSLSQATLSNCAMPHIVATKTGWSSINTKCSSKSKCGTQ